MKITYNFVDGETIEIEVNDEIGNIILDMDRCEYNNDHAETRRHISIELFDDKSPELSDEKKPEFIMIGSLTLDIQDERFNKALETLTPAQRDLIEHIYFKGMKAREYAALIGRKENTVSITHDRALKRIEKFFKKLF